VVGASGLRDAHDSVKNYGLNWKKAEHFNRKSAIVMNFLIITSGILQRYATRIISPQSPTVYEDTSK
jgi:hypothetical protein